MATRHGINEVVTMDTVVFFLPGCSIVCEIKEKKKEQLNFTQTYPKHSFWDLSLRMKLSNPFERFLHEKENNSLPKLDGHYWKRCA